MKESTYWLSWPWRLSKKKHLIAVQLTIIIGEGQGQGQGGAEHACHISRFSRRPAFPPAGSSVTVCAAPALCYLLSLPHFTSFIFLFSRLFGFRSQGAPSANLLEYFCHHSRTTRNAEKWRAIGLLRSGFACRCLT
jgi:hypothetical protein